MSKRSQIILTILTLLLISSPYFIAAGAGGDSFVFNGFLLNPLDGNSYLAKMHLGWQGDWRYTMLFSANHTPGTFLFLFYILLGHLARILGIPLLLTFHLARVLSALILLITMARFVRSVLTELDPKHQTFVYTLMCLGSGLGWLAALFGGFTSDFWVAEAFPFLSMYSNPHFCLGMALILEFFVLLKGQQPPRSLFWLILKGLTLAIVLPFGVVLAGIVGLGVQIWDLIQKSKPIRWWAALFLGPAVIAIGYQYLTVQADPFLSSWNMQNTSVTGPIWDTLISFSPAFVMAGAAIFLLLRTKSAGKYKILVVWSITGLALAYFPYELQRRFLQGYFIPLASLAGVAINQFIKDYCPKYYRIIPVILGLSFLTNILILAGGGGAIRSLDESVYYPKDLDVAMAWMQTNLAPKEVVLAPPKISLLIPGHTGARVVYGHPDETPDSERRESEVIEYFSGAWDAAEMESFIRQNNIHYVLVESLQPAQLALIQAQGYERVYQNTTYSLFSTGGTK